LAAEPGYGLVVWQLKLRYTPEVRRFIRKEGGREGGRGEERRGGTQRRKEEVEWEEGQ